MKVPEFLTEMSEQMNNEDVRCTAEPIWTVCYDKWLTCADDRGDKVILLLCDAGEYFEYDDTDYTELFEYLKEYHPVWCMKLINECDEEEDDIDELSNYFDPDDIFIELPVDMTIEKIAMQKERTIVKSCLTEEDARYFIKRKQHDYARLYTYVESMIFCPQMIELRAWIKSLTPLENKA